MEIRQRVERHGPVAPAAAGVDLQQAHAAQQAYSVAPHQEFGFRQGGELSEQVERRQNIRRGRRFRQGRAPAAIQLELFGALGSETRAEEFLRITRGPEKLAQSSNFPLRPKLSICILLLRAKAMMATPPQHHHRHDQHQRTQGTFLAAAGAAAGAGVWAGAGAGGCGCGTG